MLNKQKAKERDIQELIRLITGQSEQLEPNISAFVQQTIYGSIKKKNTRNPNDIFYEIIQSEFDKILTPFDEVFSHDEIILLISFYKEIKRLIIFFDSRAMKNFSKYRRKLFDPIYKIFRKSIRKSLSSGIILK